MFTNDYKVLDLTAQPNPKQYKLTVNSYHVYIYGENKREVFVRLPVKDGWMDAKHKRITDALSALEEAVLAAVK
jgi:hypothetical protein